MTNESITPTDKADIETLIGILGKLDPETTYIRNVTVGDAIKELQDKTAVGLRLLRLHQEVTRRVEETM